MVFWFDPAIFTFAWYFESYQSDKTQIDLKIDSIKTLYLDDDPFITEIEFGNKTQTDLIKLKVIINLIFIYFFFKNIRNTN